MKIAKILALSGLVTLLSASAVSATEHIFMGGNNQIAAYLLLDEKMRPGDIAHNDKDPGDVITCVQTLYWSPEDCSCILQTELYGRKSKSFMVGGYTKMDRWGNKVADWNDNRVVNGNLKPNMMKPIPANTFAENIYNWLQNNYWNKK